MTLTVQTAQQLLQALENATKLAVDAQCKLAALEKTLQIYRPNLWRSYLEHLDEVRKNPPLFVNEAELRALHSTLADS
jgi:hypothetical protein